MAPNVFGDPITDETLKALPEYANKETITSEDRAQVALNRKLPIPDIPVKVFGYIYNATGHTLTLAYDHDWSGHLEESSSYPQKIENGQWGTFLHIGDHPTGRIVRQSTAAVVYYANNGLIGGFCKWLLAWHSAGFIGKSKVFTVFEEPQIVKQNWAAIRERLNNSDQKHTESTSYGLKSNCDNYPWQHPNINCDNYFGPAVGKCVNHV